MSEILAPAGGVETFLSAVKSGCDAVYLGLDDFSARKNADNFNRENFEYYLAYAHTLGVKVYVCVNTLVKNKELERFFDCVGFAYACGTDAFIVQDIFLGKMLKNMVPKIQLHLSTQAGVNNLFGAQVAVENGFSRVVLARETELREIAEISKIVETEVFVQGALCTSLSGHCYMSSFIGGNSGNRGFCRQPCRKKYAYDFNDKDCYALSLSDLCLVDKLDKLLEAGVSSFKIEGRMRSSAYVSSAVELYRKALDKKNVSNAFSKLKRAFNRGNYTSGYAFGEDKNLLSVDVQGHLGEFVSKVKKIVGDSLFIDKTFEAGSGFKILNNGVEVGSAVCKTSGNELKFSGKVSVNDSVFVTKDAGLEALILPDKLKNIDVSGEFFVGKTAKLRACGITAESDFLLDEAKNQPLNRDIVLENLQKTDVYPFRINNFKYEGDNCFMTKAQLNGLRKSLFEKLFYSANEKKDYAPIEFEIPKGTNAEKVKKLAVIVSSSKIQFSDKFSEVILAPFSYDEETITEFLKSTKDFKFKRFLYIPAFANNAESAKFEKLAKNFDGLYFEGLFGLKMCEKLNLIPFGGVELNVFNSFDAEKVQSLGIEKFCFSKELSKNELSEISSFGGYVFALGSIKIMTLEYCPNSRNCKDCKVKDLNVLTDFGKREFTLRRLKTDRCRFEIFNENILTSANEFDKMLFDLSGMDFELANNILNQYFEGGIKNVAQNNKHTSGNLVNGVN